MTPQMKPAMVIKKEVIQRIRLFNFSCMESVARIPQELILSKKVGKYIERKDC